MLFEQFEVKGLAHYSYLVGCPNTKQAAIVDPRRDVDIYLQYAAAQQLKITHVLETHIHADYASGAVELAQRTGAKLCVSGYDKGELYEAAFQHNDVADGNTINIGSIKIQALHTPGHTPEHMAYLVSDTTRNAAAPAMMLSGDFLFAGSLGRPDLLGEDAKRRLAEQLFESVRHKLSGLPDDLQICPAHGAGSMCGAGMRGQATSTLGLERRTNPYLDPKLTKEEFVARILGSVPPFPPYYRRMKQVNAAGAPVLETLPGNNPIEPAQFRALVEASHVIIDLRGQLPFGAGHIPRSFGIGLGDLLAVWAAWVVPYDTPLLLVAERPQDVEAAARWLVRVGLDDVRGYLAGGFEAWKAAGYPVAETRQLTPAEAHQRMGHGAGLRLVDVRGDGEWRGGHAPGAIHLMGGFLADRADELRDRTGEIATMCGGGYRSTVAASVLERAGFQNVFNVTGGMQAWRAAGLPVAQET